MSITRQSHPRKAKTQAIQEIERIYVRESLTDDIYFTALRNHYKRIESTRKITLNECKAMYKKDGIDGIVPFKSNPKFRPSIFPSIIKECIRSYYHYKEYPYLNEEVPEILQFYKQFTTDALKFIYEKYNGYDIQVIRPAYLEQCQ